MSIEVKKLDDSNTQILVQEEMTIYNVLAQKNALLLQLNSGKNLEIDLSEVSEIDSAGIQLLIFLKREANCHGLNLNLTNHSQAVVEVVTLFNLSSFFGDPVVIPADWNSL